MRMNWKACAMFWLQYSSTHCGPFGIAVLGGAGYPGKSADVTSCPLILPFAIASGTSSQ